MIKLENVQKTYRLSKLVSIPALRGVDIEIPAGQFVAVMGPSGSGKSTLMHIIGCLDRPSGGRYFLEGEDVSRKSDDLLADVRNRKVGFVFQSFNLLPRLNALENVEVPLIYRGTAPFERRRRAREGLATVGLSDRLRHRPLELSGGEQQRVAIARAVIGQPAIILADEPTGSLDSRSEDEILKIFHRFQAGGMTIVMVTHEESVARHADRLIRLRDGRVVEDN